MKNKNPETARLYARFPKAQKEFLLKAALLGGHRNLTDFILRTVQEKAAEIVLEKEGIIASGQDTFIFSNGITNLK